MPKQEGRPKLYKEVVNVTISIESDVLKTFDRRKGEKSRGQYIKELLEKAHGS